MRETKEGWLEELISRREEMSIEVNPTLTTIFPLINLLIPSMVHRNQTKSYSLELMAVTLGLEVKI